MVITATESAKSLELIEDGEDITTVILDSTQLFDFLTCPTLWRYSHHEQLIKVDQWPKRALVMGTYGHKLLELYYKTRAEGLNMSAGIEAALAFDPYTESATNNKPFELAKDTYELIRQRFREYCYTYSNSDFIVKRPEDIEIGFSHLVYEDDKCRYILEGRIDVLCEMSEQQMFADHKFQERASTLYKKSIQFRNYAMVTGCTIGLVNYVRVNKSISKDTFSRDIISFTTAELRHWETELINIFVKVKHFVYDTDITSDWYKNRASCSGRYGYPCEFTPLCEEHDSRIIDAKKQTLYGIKERWEPW